MKLEFEYNDQLRAVPKDSRKFHKYIEVLSDSLSKVNLKEKVTVLGELAVYLRINGSVDLAEEYLLEALSIIEKENLGRQKEVQQKIRLGHVLQFKRRFDESNKLFSEILKTCSKSSDLASYKAFALQHSGKNLFDQGRYREALILFQQALEIRLRDNVAEDQVDSTRSAIERTTELISMKSQLAEMYDGMADIYDEKVKTSNYIGPAWLFDHLSDSIKTDDIEILDLGCANGINIKNVKGVNNRIRAVGIDISPNMIEVARNTDLYESVHVHSLDSELDFIEDKSYPVIFALGCLEFVTNIELCLDEISRICTDIGEVYVSFQMYEEDNRLAPRQSRSGTVIHHGYSRNEVIQMLEFRGFSLSILEEVTGYTGGYPCPYLMVKAMKRNGASIRKRQHIYW